MKRFGPQRSNPGRRPRPLAEAGRRCRAIATFTAVLAGLTIALGSVASAPAAEADGDAKLPWPYHPVERPEIPAVADPWIRNPIDAFILARLQAAELTPSPPADRTTLLRRAVFDLHGLPPTPEQVREFLADTRPDAYEALIDRLLASPRYGERWARLWLDLVRYAESDGYNQDAARSTAWRYRDYVIQAFNADKPYDCFIREQIAGDELPDAGPEQLAAAGFLRHWPYEFNQRNVPLQRSIILNDLTDVAGQAFLGLTIQCARCHDHKFDPIEQLDYFRLQAFFAPLTPREAPLWDSPGQEARYREQLEQWEAATAELRQRLELLEAAPAAALVLERKSLFPKEIQALIDMPREQRNPLQQQLAALAEKQLEYDAKDLPRYVPAAQRAAWETQRKEILQALEEFAELKPLPPEQIMTVADVGPQAPPTIVPEWGEYDAPGTYIEPGWLAIFDRSDLEGTPVNGGTGRRTLLANWLASGDNPLTARVMVNRLWQGHFRQGLVATSNDFGKQGSGCSHPELLDWLADEFVASGWSLKSMHRLMMTSAAYRQQSESSSASDAQKRAAQVDPDNTLLWRMRAGRIDAETLRDALLAAGGGLSSLASGPSAYGELPEGLGDKYAWTPSPQAEQRNRRSIYLFVKRNRLHPLLENFDMPGPSEPCGRRQETTTPLQSLMLLNGAWTLEQAQRLAGGILRKAGGWNAQAVRQAWLAAYGREASAAEVAHALKFVDEQAARISNAADSSDSDSSADLPENSAAGAPARTLPLIDERPDPCDLTAAQASAVVDFCHVLLNSSEFLFVD